MEVTFDLGFKGAAVWMTTSLYLDEVYPTGDKVHVDRIVQCPGWHDPSLGLES